MMDRKVFSRNLVVATRSMWAGLIAVLVGAGCTEDRTTVQSREAAVLDRADAAPATDREAPPLEPGTLGTGWAEEFTETDPADDRDLDHDGFVGDLDPDDESALVFPGATEVPCNGVDENGDGIDSCPVDMDGDGTTNDLDCDDMDLEVGPLLAEVQCNGRDENCDGIDDCDEDGDGVVDAYDPDPSDPGVPEGRIGEPLF